VTNAVRQQEVGPAAAACRRQTSRVCQQMPVAGSVQHAVLSHHLGTSSKWSAVQASATLV
jgi:hypothetical protein